MSKPGSAAKVKLNSYDDLFGSVGVQADTAQVQEIPLSELHDFKGHPFKVLDDEKMQETVESIKNYGVLMPGIVRTRAEGGYEIIAGHRRKHGCELAGLSTMPVFVKEYTDDEATVIMVDTNIQREDILPSEKARAYSMKYEEMDYENILKCLPKERQEELADKRSYFAEKTGIGNLLLERTEKPKETSEDYKER